VKAKDLAARVEAELIAQGLSRAMTDPTVVRRVCALPGGEDPNRRARRLEEARRELANVEIRTRIDEGEGF
jgi:hypothetical protein